MVKLGGNLGNFSLKICQSMGFGLCTWEYWVKIESLSTEVSRWDTYHHLFIFMGCWIDNLAPFCSDKIRANILAILAFPKAITSIHKTNFRKTGV